MQTLKKYLHNNTVIFSHKTPEIEYAVYLDL